MKTRLLVLSVLTLLALGAVYASIKAKPAKLGPDALAKQIGCVQCHAPRGVVIGPAYHDIAARYATTTGARALLIERVKNGSKGYWSEISHRVPMPPYRGRLSNAEIESLVDWVLEQ